MVDHCSKLWEPISEDGHQWKVRLAHHDLPDGYLKSPIIGIAFTAEDHENIAIQVAKLPLLLRFVREIAESDGPLAERAKELL